MVFPRLPLSQMADHGDFQLADEVGHEHEAVLSNTQITCNVLPA